MGENLVFGDLRGALPEPEAIAARDVVPGG